MSQFNKYLFRYLAIAIFFLVITACKSFSQPSTIEAKSDNELLAIYKKVIIEPDIAVMACCTIFNRLLFEDLLKRAIFYDQHGCGQCANTTLNYVHKNYQKLSPHQNCRLNLAWSEYFTFHQSYDSAEHYAMVANIAAGTQNWKNEKAEALLLLSAGGLKRRKISLAYALADSALVIVRQTDNKILEGRILLQLALCARRNFTALGKRSFPYYVIAREKAIEAADSTTLAAIDLYLATDNFELLKWSEGVNYLKEGITLSLNKKNPDLACKSFIALGYCMALKAHTAQTLLLYTKALRLSQQLQQAYTTQVTYHQIADTWLALKHYDSALVYANLSANVPGIDSFWANVWELKASIYYDMGKYKMAAVMYQKSNEWLTGDFLYRNQSQLSEYEAKLNTKEKELQVTQQKKRALQLEWIIGGAFSLLLISVWAISVQRKARQKLYLQNRIIEKQRSELVQSLGDKDILLKEIHHRVKNNLSVITSLLELQSNGIDDEAAKAAIAVGQNRVSSIALIHQRLYLHENLEAIELRGFLQDLFGHVSNIFKKPNIEIQFENIVPETLIDIDTAVPLSLITNELLTNSYKYAFNKTKVGKIKINLQQQSKGEFIMIYADNGPGIDKRINIKNTSSLGLRLINRLSKQIGGKANYSYHNGCTFTIYFKNSNLRKQE